MGTVTGAASFGGSGAAYDGFMGRYSQPLAVGFADLAGIQPGMTALDVGCGPGALTGVLADRLGPASVAACDPSESFVAACADRHPGVDVRSGRAEALPFDDGTFDAVLAELVLHFVEGPEEAARELRRVVRPGGVVAACVWDFADGMQMLRHFWDAALTVDPGAPDEARVLRFGRQGEITDLLASAGFEEPAESRLVVASTYADFDELWSGFLAGVGPAGTYCLALPEADRDRVRAVMHRGLGSPAGAVTLEAVARCATARAPGGA